MKHIGNGQYNIGLVNIWYRKLFVTSGPIEELHIKKKYYITICKIWHTMENSHEVFTINQEILLIHTNESVS